MPKYAVSWFLVEDRFGSPPLRFAPDLLIYCKRKQWNKYSPEVNNLSKSALAQTNNNKTLF